MSWFEGIAALPWWLRPAAALFAASLCAEIALMPVGAFVFSRVTFAGLLVNFAAIPLMTLIQIAGMITSALAAPAPDMALWVGWIAHWAVEGLVGSASLVDVMPWLTRRLAPPSLWIVTGYYVALVAALASRRVSYAAAAFGLWIIIAPDLASGAIAPLLRVTFLDVGQGWSDRRFLYQWE